MGLSALDRMGPNLCPDNAVRAEANKNTMESASFKTACEVAGVEPTRRQASRWNMKRGSAWTNRA